MPYADICSFWSGLMLPAYEWSMDMVQSNIEELENLSDRTAQTHRQVLVLVTRMWSSSREMHIL